MTEAIFDAGLEVVPLRIQEQERQASAAQAALAVSIRNVEHHNAHLEDAQLGAIPKTTAEVTTAHALLGPAGLAWEVVDRPIITIDGEPVPGRKALVRCDTGKVVGDVGANYGVIQNEQLAELADAIRGVDDSWTFAQGGALRGGSRVFMQLRAPCRNVGGEQLQSNVSLFNSFDGSLKFSCGFSDVVIVCKNTFQAARKDSLNGMFLRHTSNVAQRIETAAKLLEEARKHYGAVDNDILGMMNRPFTLDGMIALAEELIPGDGGKAKHARTALLRAYRHAPGAAEGTAWGGFQAVTNYATHDINIRQTSGRSEGEARVESNWWGSGAEMTQNAWDVLTDDEQTKQLVYVRVVRA